MCVCDMLNSMQAVKTLRGHGGQRVSALAWSASGRSLLSAADYDICHWDVLKGELRSRKKFESKVRNIQMYHLSACLCLSVRERERQRGRKETIVRIACRFTRPH